ncbi:MAG TPA: YvcK family protein [Candidatus Aquilonibacter sp.]|nr:YvcK family protein [Candidatus Aquilonibacter sp.]
MRSRVMKPLQWLIPGIGVKRWLFIAFIGFIVLLDGFDRWMVAEGMNLPFNEIIDNIVDDYFSPSYLTYIFVALGIILIAIGIRQWLHSMVRAASSGGGILDTLLDRRLENGYNIVTIGGGTGLSTLLRGLKRRTRNLTAIVTVSDDGGSSGRLQKELGVLPPGDVRNCLVALADDEALVTDLFRYRFEEGEGLIGHSFGNLFLAAMTGITGNFDKAIKESSRVLNIVGRVLPSTLSVVRLCAELDNGTIVEGESNIPKANRPIRRVFFDPDMVAPLEESLEAIRSADAIVLGPGSLFTSILPNFLIDRITQEVARARGVKIYVCNVMTQPGETENMSAADHVEALFGNAGARVCDYVIVNVEPPSKLRQTYAQEGQVPVSADIERIEAMGLTAVKADMLSENEKVRHDPDRLGDVVLGVIDRAVAERATFVRPASAYAKAAVAAGRR